MFKLKGRGLLLITLAVAVAFSFSVPKAGAVTIAELLVQIQALQAQLTQLQAGTTTATACTFTKSLYLGVSDSQVKCLQQYLNSAGYPVAISGVGSAGSETNYYGGLTKAAVAKWQAANAVSPAAGYFGAISRAKYSAVAGGAVVVTPGGTVVTPPVGGGLSVGLSYTTQAARTIVNGSANMAFGKWTFTAGSGNVTVTTLKFTKSGISSDAELGNAYLYDADTGDYISQYTGLGSGILSFANTSGLFTVNAGQTKNVELRLDISGASNNHTMAWGLNAATDVVSNASAVSGAFPSTSNAMTFVTVSDPEVATLTATPVTTGGTVNAGTTGYLAGSFKLVAANSAVLLDRIIITQNGSIISGTDVANIKLVTTGGQQIGQVLPNLNSDGKGTFVMSPAYEIPSGQTIQVNVYADILAGVHRNLIFNILNTRDIQARDKTYNVGIRPTASVAMTTTEIGAGTLVITLDPSSPTGNVAPGQTNVTVAKFKVVAYGEQVKVLWIPFSLVMTGAGTDFTDEVDNVYMVDDAGNQIGTTITTPDSDTTGDPGSGTWDNTSSVPATFGTDTSTINYLIPANTTRIWSLKLDVLTTTAGLDATDIKASLVAGTNNYQGQISGVSDGDTTAVGGNTLTITSNPFQASLNSGLGVGFLVKGQSAARIGSFTLSASTAEGVNVSTVTVTSSTTFPFANLYIKVNGVQFGTITGSVTTSHATGVNYTFSGSAPVMISAGATILVDVYADILSTATNLGSAYYVKLYDVSGVGATTATTQSLYGTAASAAVSGSNIIAQRFTVNTGGGTLTIAKDSSTPAAYQAVMGQTGKSLGIWRFSGGQNSDISITDMRVTDIATSTDQTVDPNHSIASLTNLQWYKGGVAVGPIIISGTASAETAINPLVTYGYKYTFHFTSPIIVPQNDGISLELRGSIPTFASGGAQSNSTHTLRIEAVSDVTALSTSGSLAATISGPNNSTGLDTNAVTVVRSKLAVTTSSTYGYGGSNTILATGHSASMADVIAAFVFTADSANSVIINTVSLKMSGSTLVTLTIKLIDDETGSTWGSASPSESAGLALGRPTNVGAISVGGAGTTTVVFKPLYTLTAGASKKVRVVADTTGLTATAGTTNGSLVQIYMDNSTSGSYTAYTGIGEILLQNINAIGWYDGISDGLNLETKVLPIYAPAIRY